MSAPDQPIWADAEKRVIEMDPNLERFRGRDAFKDALLAAVTAFFACLLFGFFAGLEALSEWSILATMAIVGGFVYFYMDRGITRLRRETAAMLERLEKSMQP